jgi:YggT family protein|tara:strand:+ start:272 stop:454 length:183 start_codon:yes stop_codon:yes gene_type:complete
LSWINISPYNPISRITHQITEPLLGKIRQYIKPLGMFDFSPMIAIILLEVIQRVAASLLR